MKAQRSPPHPTAQKALLFCPKCDHRSPPDGDWVYSVRSHGVEYRCPTCETLLTVRPRTAEPTDDDGRQRPRRDDSEPTRAWHCQWTRWTRAWTRWVEALTRPSSARRDGGNC